MSVQISENGLLSIYPASTSTPTITEEYNPNNFPTVTDPTPTSSNPAPLGLIAPFWSEIDSSVAGTVSYRVLNGQREIGQKMFDKINDIVCEAGSESGFEVDWILVATWNRVAFEDTMSGCSVVRIFSILYDIYHFK